jgi:hypothetical protein
MSKKATEYAVLIWDFKPEDFPSLGCPCREINVDTLPEAMVLYEKETDVFAKELHHYYEVDTKEWESSSNCLMEWDAYDGTSEWMDEYDEHGEPIGWFKQSPDCDWAGFDEHECHPDATRCCSPCLLLNGYDVISDEEWEEIYRKRAEIHGGDEE